MTPESWGTVKSVVVDGQLVWVPETLAEQANNAARLRAEKERRLALRTPKEVEDAASKAARQRRYYERYRRERQAERDHFSTERLLAAPSRDGSEVLARVDFTDSPHSYRVGAPDQFDFELAAYFRHEEM